MAGELDRTLGVGIHSVGSLTGDAQLVSPTNMGTGALDWNTLTSPGWYTHITNSATNSPSDGAGYWYSIQVILPDSQNVWQFAYKHQNSGLYKYFRMGYNITTTPVWSTWRQESASGSNSNGSYAQFADGTQICLVQNMTFGSQATGGSQGLTVYVQTANGAWPAAFTALPAIQPEADVNGTGITYVKQHASTSTTYRVQIATTVANFTLAESSIIAIGRWY